MTYIGQITAGTPATHRDVTLAVAISADDQVATTPNGWCGQIIEPVKKPDPVSGVEWSPTVALLDGTIVRMLKRGARCKTAMIMTDQSLDVLPGVSISVGTVAGEVKQSANTYTNTTPTGPENAAVNLDMGLQHVGYADSVAEDVPGSDIALEVNWA